LEVVTLLRKIRSFIFSSGIKMGRNIQVVIFSVIESILYQSYLEFIKKNATRCNNVSEFYYSIFI